MEWRRNKILKIGRNDKCYCRSGKKYKKCCLERDEHLIKKQSEGSVPFQHVSYEEVNAMETDEIVYKLEEMNIPFDEKTFLEDIEEYYSAQEISENWFSLYPVNAIGRDQDYPWFAAWILWERLAPTGHLSMEQMDNLYEHGFDYLEGKDVVSACDVWLEFWEAIKVRNEPEYQSLDYLDEQYRGSFFIRNFCQDLEMELYNAGESNALYFDKRIKYCREFCDMFPKEKELIVRNMQIAIAESYWELGQYKQAESEYNKIIEDFSHSPWGYISWGDMLFFKQNKNLKKAKELYEKAKAIAKNKDDLIVVNERLEHIEGELSN